MNLKLKVKKMKKIICGSTWYKVIFECDKELIPDKSNRSLIKNCSLTMHRSPNKRSDDEHVQNTRRYTSNVKRK